MSTALKKWPAEGESKRIYVQRPKLQAKLWFERRGDSFEIRHYGNDADFGVVSVPGEPIAYQEARAALSELGLDINRCRWADILAKAK